MSTISAGEFIIFGATALSVIGMFLIRRWASKAQLNKYQGLADPSLNVIATLFSILLGFLVAGAMDDFSDARTEVETEASRLVEVYHLSDALPLNQRLAIHKLCREYTEAVVTEEWPAMGLEKTSHNVWADSNKIRRRILAFNPQTDREVNIHSNMLTCIQDMDEARRDRILDMRNELSPALWMVVIGGSVVLIACMYCFYIPSTMVQALMTLLVALSLFLNVFLLAVYSSPFKGDLRIQPDAFVLDERLFSTPEQPDIIPDPPDTPDKAKGKSDK